MEARDKWRSMVRTVDPESASIPRETVLGRDFEFSSLILPECYDFTLLHAKEMYEQIVATIFVCMLPLKYMPQSTMRYIYFLQ